MRGNAGKYWGLAIIFVGAIILTSLSIILAAERYESGEKVRIRESFDFDGSESQRTLIGINQTAPVVDLCQYFVKIRLLRRPESRIGNLGALVKFIFRMQRNCFVIRETGNLIPLIVNDDRYEPAVFIHIRFIHDRGPDSHLSVLLRNIRR